MPPYSRLAGALDLAPRHDCECSRHQTGLRLGQRDVGCEVRMLSHGVAVSLQEEVGHPAAAVSLALLSARWRCG